MAMPLLITGLNDLGVLDGAAGVGIIVRTSELNCAIRSMLSRKGKKASEARIQPFKADLALRRAKSTASIRDTWPVPIPTVVWSLASKMAFDFKCFNTCHAKSRVFNLVGRRLRCRHHLQCSRFKALLSWSWTKRPP